MITIDQIKQLREETGVSPIEIKKALEQAAGNVKKAKELLRVWGKTLANKKTSRETRHGIVDAYIHPDSKTGVLLDIRCESDFVAKSPDFRNLAHEICLQIAAMKPLFVREEDIPEEFLDGEEEVSLLSQPWIKDDSKTIKNLIENTIAKVGENIEVKKFTRYSICS